MVRATGRYRLRRALFLGGLLFLLGRGALHAQQQGVVATAANALIGATQTGLGVEIEIYRVQLQDNFAFPGGLSPYLGNNGVPIGELNRGIRLTISDLSTPTGLTASDFTGLNIYRSTNNIFGDGDDVGPLNAAPVAVTVGGITEIDVTGLALASRIIPTAPGIYFIVTAVIDPGASPGRAFRVGAAALHIGIDDIGAGAVPDYRLGGAIIASDGNFIVMGAQTPAFLGGAIPPGRTIPFGGEPVVLVMLIGTGLYMIRRQFSSR